MPEAVIRRCDQFLEISLDGSRPLPRDIAKRLERDLTYTIRKVTFDFGEGTNNQSEHRVFYSYDHEGRLICQRGLRRRVERLLREQGYSSLFTDVTDVSRRDPRRYEACWDGVVSCFEFRPTQDQCLAAIDMHDHGVIDAVTAFGKMWVIMMACVLYPRAKIDVVVKRKDVALSLRRRLTRYLPNIGQVGGGKRSEERITVRLAGSLHHNDFDADIVLADEVHELMTDNYAAKLGLYPDARMFGFTASKETRMDNAHERMEGLFGPTIFKLDYPTAQSLGLVAPIEVRWLDVWSPRNPVAGLNSLVEKKRHGVWRNQERNAVFAEAARRLADSGNQVLMLVDTLEHALFLRLLLPDFELCYGGQPEPKRVELFRRAGLLNGVELDMTAEKRDRLRIAFENREVMRAIATPIWTTGVSFDGLNVLGRLNATDSKTEDVQLPGRVARIHDESGKQAGIVLDAVDRWDSRFRDKSLNRRRSYAANGWRQILPDGREYVPRKRRRRATVNKG